MKILENYPLSDFLWYKIGGKARYFVEVSSPEDIPELLTFLKETKPAKVFICGLGSNLVFTDEDFDGVVIAIAEPKEKKPLLVTEQGELTVFAGDTMDSAILFAFANNLIGLEWAGGLPGTVGAGVRGNVGAFGGEVKDLLVRAEVLSLNEPQKGMQTLTNEELRFAYRHSLIKEHPELLVISATFQLRHGTNEDINEAKSVYENNKAHRKANHPLDYPNCGSVFKNIRDHEKINKVLSIYPHLAENVETKWHGKLAVAPVIELLGLKGHKIGNAQISEKHALFIINLGGAKAADVRQIIADVQNKFQETFGFQLEVEVEVVT